MKNQFQLNDTEFESAFKNCTLDSKLFNHEAHLRLAWIHIHKYGEEKAIQNITSQILDYVDTLDATDKYNKTLTIAAIKAVYHFFQKSKSDNFSNFIQEFPRLKNNFKELLACHYQMDIYNSKQAKVKFLKPDLLPFD